MKRYLQIGTLLACIAPVSLHASLVFQGLVTFRGTGLGTMPTILTLQNNGTESGCVATIGGVDVIGSAACAGGVSVSNSQMPSVSLADALPLNGLNGSVSSYGDVSLVLTGNGTVNLNDLS